MKTYRIGNGPDCDISTGENIYTDSMHAVLFVDDDGTMHIVDVSTNGTFVNGIRIERGAEVLVSRKDNVSFAQVYDLPWGSIPIPRKKKLPFFSICLVALVLIVPLAYYGFRSMENGHSGTASYGPAPTTIIHLGGSRKDVIDKEAEMQRKLDSINARMSGNASLPVESGRIGITSTEEDQGVNSTDSADVIQENLHEDSQQDTSVAVNNATVEIPKPSDAAKNKL